MEEEEPSQAEEEAERSAKKNEKNSFDHKKALLAQQTIPTVPIYSMVAALA